MAKWFQLHIWGLVLVLQGPGVALGAGQDSRANIERAVELIEAGQHSLARSYLAPALIDHRLTHEERSRAYYLRGYSYLAEEMPVSARLDYTRALEYNARNPAVLVAIGRMQFAGLGGDQNQALAVEFFREAAVLGHPVAMQQLGFAYLVGAGTDRNMDLARQWLQSAVDAGVQPALLQLALTYRADHTDTPDTEKASALYQQAWQAGLAEAQVALGYMAQSGELPGTVAENEAAAFAHFRAAAEAGSGAGMASLAHMYLTGRGVEKDAAQALKHFQAAAALDVPAAFLGLGYMFDAGEGVKADSMAADGWYRRAAEAGLTEGQFRYAYRLLQQKSAQTHLEARHWLERALGQDDPRAHNDFAWLLSTSPFDEVRDAERAVVHAKTAVERARSAAHLDTLAAAYAESGMFEEAIATQEEALAAADQENSAALDELRAHLEVYRRSEPWRE